MSQEKTKLTVSWDFKEAVKSIRKRLSLYGITIEEYVKTGGNLTGSLFIPSQLAILNMNLKVEDAFYFVANKVFIACDTFCFGIPGQFEYNWKEVVGKHVFNTFQSAIFEEINQRFLSNSFPEFQNAQTIVPNNMTIMSNAQAGGVDIRDYLNAITKQKLLAINWSEIDPQNQYDPQLMKDKDLLFTDMSNLNMPVSTSKHFLLTKEDGRFYQVSEDNIATSASVKALESEVEKNEGRLGSLLDDVNVLTRRVDELKDSKVILPRDIEVWQSTKQYEKYDYVFYGGGIYIALQPTQNQLPTENNVSVWQEVNRVYQTKGGDLVYQAGTDVKFSFTNPNVYNYISLKIFQTDKDSLTVTSLFLKICDELKKVSSQSTVDFKIEDTVELVNGLCGLTLSLSEKDTNIKSDVDKMLTAFCYAYGWRYQNEVLLFANNSFDSVFSANSSDFGESDHFLRVSHSETNTGGSNIITRANLPNVTWDTSHTHALDASVDETAIDIRDFNLKLKLVSRARRYIYSTDSFSYEDAYAGPNYPYFCIGGVGNGGGSDLSAYESVEWDSADSLSALITWDNSRISHTHKFSGNIGSSGDTLKLNPDEQTEFIPEYQNVIVREVTNALPSELLAKLWVNFRRINSQNNEVIELPVGYPTITTIKDKILPEFFNEKLSIVHPNELLYVNDADHKVFMSVNDVDIHSVKNTIQEFQKLNQSPDPSVPTQNGIATTSFVNSSLDPEKWTEDMIRALANRLSRYLQD